MNDNYEYAAMLEIPVQTCTVSKKVAEDKPKRGRKKKIAEVKDEVVEKVNARIDNADKGNQKSAPAPDNNALTEQAQPETKNVVNNADTGNNQAALTCDAAQNGGIENDSKVEENNASDALSQAENAMVRPKEKKKFKFTLIGAETAMIIALIAVIAITNLVFSGSGINTLFKMMNGTYIGGEKSNTAAYSTFSATLPAAESSITLTDGVMTINKSGSIFAPCNGTVSTVNEADGKYTLEITHSKNFKTVVSGLNYSYVKSGDKVYGNIPIGYLKSDAVTVSLYSGENLIKDYTISGGVIVWSV